MPRVECAAARLPSLQDFDLYALGAGVRLGLGALGVCERPIAIPVARRPDEQGDLVDGLSGAGHVPRVVG
jgi:hypothetical protein